MAQRILVVDDDRYDNDRYCQLLASIGYEVEGVLNAEQALNKIVQERFDVVLLDMLLPLRLMGRLDFGGLEVLSRIKQVDSTIQVIAVTGYGSRELAAEAMMAGALDYITKDPDTDDRLPGSVRVAAARAQILRARNQQQHDQTVEPPLATPEQLVADSEAMRRVLRRAQRLANIDSPLLIVGEAGTGKELLANVIHLNSNFTAGPFVVVPCRSLSSTLVELWGDSTRPGSGYCLQADSGTLVLKGVHELPFNHQKQLVALVERQIYTPIAANLPVQGNLRIIATTTADLDRLTRHGRFWRPLYEALSVATLEVPPLRDRHDKDDILAIAGYLLRRYDLAPGISSNAATALANYDYIQGNIKELEEIVRNASTQSNGKLIELEHLPPAVRGSSPSETTSHPVIATPDSAAFSIRFIMGDPPILIWDSYMSGSSRSVFVLPFAAADLPLILRALDAVQWPGHPAVGPKFNPDEQARLTQFGFWENDRVTTDIDRRLGQLLYQALITDSAARAALTTIRNNATDKGQPLSLTLRFESDGIMLAALPWELLWDEQQAFLLSRRKLASCVRYLDIPQAVPPPPIVNRKLKLLAVCPTKGIPDHLHETEEQGRMDALRPLVDAGMLVIEELRPAYKSALTDRLQDGQKVDILHFYGHGLWKNDRAYLQFDDGLLNANQIATLVSDIPLVVLHACRSGTVGDDDLFTGIAPALSAEGVSAVVAMQFTVGIPAANRFSVVLYRNLAKGESLQTAVAKARQALFIEHSESWYVPVVYIRSRDTGPFVLVR